MSLAISRYYLSLRILNIYYHALFKLKSRTAPILIVSLVFIQVVIWFTDVTCFSIKNDLVIFCTPGRLARGEETRSAGTGKSAGAKTLMGAQKPAGTEGLVDVKELADIEEAGVIHYKYHY